MTADVCVNCEEVVRRTPVYFDGEPYCCVGCVSSGPCLCTYEDDSMSTNVPPAPTRQDAPAPTLPTEHAPSDVRPAAPAPVVDAPTPETWPVSSPVPPSGPATEPPAASEGARSPIPFRRPGTKAIVVHAAGFQGQRDLLAFASMMEQQASFTEVALTRVTSTEAWFAVRATSPEEVVEAMTTFQGFALHTVIDQNLVEVRVGHASTAADAPPSRSPHNEGETLLPPRPRFRVFRSATEAPPTPPATPPAQESAAPPPATPQQEQGADVPPPAMPPRPASPAPPPPPAAPQASATRPAAPRLAEPPPAVPAEAPAPAASAGSSSPSTRDTETVPPRAERDAPEDFVNPDERPGGAVSTQEHLTLVVYPFRSFAALNDFQAAVRGLHGVKNTRVRRFYRGTLHLAVDYEDMIPLSERLHDLKSFAFEVASETRSEIELVLEESGPLVAAGEK